MDYVAGYVIFNDITARDIQRREMRSGVFSFCKAIDTFCPLGPWIVTPDEIPDPHDLAMELRVNGDVRQTSHSGRMSTTIPEILSHYSPLGYSAGRRRLDRHGLRRRRLQRGRGRALPPAGRRDGGRDRADRRAPQPGRLLAGGARRSSPATRPLVDELAARRREARARARADGRGGLRRARRPRARQRPLPEQLLGHEGLRRRRLPEGGRTDADLPRGLRGRRGAHGVDDGRPALPRLRRERSAATARADGRRRTRGGVRLRPHRARADARHPGGRPHGRRADHVHPRLLPRVRHGDRGRDSTARARTRAQDRAGDRAHAARERDRGGGHGARPLQPRARDEGERGGRHLERLRPRPRHRLGGQGRARARLLARLVGAGYPDLHGDRTTGRCRSTSRRSSRSGSAPTATGATTPRTSARAS